MQTSSRYRGVFKHSIRIIIHFHIIAYDLASLYTICGLYLRKSEC